MLRSRFLYVYTIVSRETFEYKKQGTHKSVCSLMVSCYVFFGALNLPERPGFCWLLEPFWKPDFSF